MAERRPPHLVGRNGQRPDLDRFPFQWIPAHFFPSPYDPLPFSTYCTVPGNFPFYAAEAQSGALKARDAISPRRPKDLHHIHELDTASSITGPVEPALRELHHQCESAKAAIQSCFDAWKEDKSKLGYAKAETLNALWHDMLKAKWKGDENVTTSEGLKTKLNHMKEKISQCMAEARTAACRNNFLAESSSEYFRIRRRRAVDKVDIDVRHILSLIDVIEADPLAASHLLAELADVLKALDPKQHKDLYGEETDTAGNENQEPGYNY